MAAIVQLISSTIYPQKFHLREFPRHTQPSYRVGTSFVFCSVNTHAYCYSVCDLQIVDNSISATATY